jgi:hypothetical protein
MIYHSNKALERLVWRFSQGKAFTPNENDVNALNTLIMAFNEQSTSIQPTSEPFATLYVYCFNQLLEHYDVLPSSELAQEELFNIITNGIEPQIEQMQMIINSKLIDSTTSKAGMSDKMAYEQSQLDKAIDKEVVKTIDGEKLKNKMVSFDFVKRNIVTQINKVIDKMNAL